MRNAILTFTIFYSLLIFTSCGNDNEITPEKISHFTVNCFKGKYNYSDENSTPVIVWTFTPNPDIQAEYYHNSEPFNSSWCMPTDRNPLMHKNFRQLIPELQESLPYGKAVLGDTLSAVVDGEVVERIILYIPSTLTTIPNYQTGNAVLKNEYVNN